MSGNILAAETNGEPLAKISVEGHDILYYGMCSRLFMGREVSTGEAKVKVVPFGKKPVDCRFRRLRMVRIFSAEFKREIESFFVDLLKDGKHMHQIIVGGGANMCNTVLMSRKVYTRDYRRWIR